MLYKKKDRKDIRNYRPITLLNGDYKILTRVLCRRMKRVIGKVISRENTGFSPGRFIAENTHQMRLMQKMLEEDDTDGMFVFLDLEKAFDRVSWKYMRNAVERLGFGDDFVKWIGILYDENSAPTRRLRINGHEGKQFELRCGTAQGCPLSPLLYLCVMEAFSRTVKNDPRVKGIRVGRSEFKLSQFADDTVLLLRTFDSIDRVWRILETVRRATGQTVNANKTEGLLLGRMRNDPRAPAWIKWCQDGDYIISLGVPFGNDFDDSPQEMGFWKKIYHKTKAIMARWGAIFSQTLRGRVMIANSMVYSRFRYWTQVMVMPEEVIGWLEEDIHELLWAKDPLFVSGQEGQDKQSKRKIKRDSAKIAWRSGGIGLLVWTEHLKSLRRKWAIRYLNHERGAWKEVLDRWMCRGHTLGRGVVFGTGDLPDAPNEFWKRVFEEFRELELERTDSDYEDPDEAAEEPVWEGREIDPPDIQNQDMWDEELGLRQVKDWINRRTGRPWSTGKWMGWARQGAGLQAMGGRNQMVADYRAIENAIDAQVQVATARQQRGWAANETVAYFDQTGEMKLGEIIRPAHPDVVRRVELTTQGEKRVLNRVVTIPQQAYDERGEMVGGPPMWRTRWVEVLEAGNNKIKREEKESIEVFDGVAGITYPRLKNYAAKLSGDKTEKLMELTVKQMTRSEVDKTTVRPTCEHPRRWPVELNLPRGATIDWSEVWDTFKVGLATPVDFGTRFRMIHGDLGTRSKLGQPGGCRLGCGAREEKHIHLVRCHRLQPLWRKLIGILEGLRGSRFRDWRQAVILGWTRAEGKIEKGSVAMMSMLLKIIYIDWYLMIREGREFDYEKVWRIFWRRAERQWKETARDKEYELRNIKQRGSSDKSTWIGISRQLNPIGEIDRATCEVTCNIDWRKHEDY